MKIAGLMMEFVILGEDQQTLNPQVALIPHGTALDKKTSSQSHLRDDGRILELEKLQDVG